MPGKRGFHRHLCLPSHVLFLHMPGMPPFPYPFGSTNQTSSLLWDIPFILQDPVQAAPKRRDLPLPPLLTSLLPPNLSVPSSVIRLQMLPLFSQVTGSELGTGHATFILSCGPFCNVALEISMDPHLFGFLPPTPTTPLGPPLSTVPSMLYVLSNHMSCGENLPAPLMASGAERRSRAALQKREPGPFRPDGSSFPDLKKAASIHFRP